ncbi:hypothetical protein ARMGADRAFT_1022668 [Armillaria gallica]|uniref:Uncharacterized protein n=1 Tax=Armillaria gallica TaxID=47427 RepID=A0A2H3ENU0_ARMGA|nr:hypothetical protein ARMGADRAFT_1022668 [Armillaria gallica]
MSSWFSTKASTMIYGLKSVVNLGLAGSINMFVPKPIQPLFEWNKTKQTLHNKRGGIILDEAVHHFSAQIWWSGTCTLTISTGWHTSKNLNGIKHFTIWGFNPTGRMVFTTELANRIVDSRAWIYKANKTTVTFKAKDYKKVIY